MNKRGFTLVEVLIVIILLGAIMTLTVPLVLNYRKDTTDLLGEQEKKNIKDAATILAMDLDDSMSDIYNCKSGSWIVTDTNASCQKEASYWKEVELTVELLKIHKYFEDQASHCKGSIKIEYNNGNYKVTLKDDVSCS